MTESYDVTPSNFSYSSISSAMSYDTSYDETILVESVLEDTPDLSAILTTRGSTTCKGGTYAGNATPDRELILVNIINYNNC